MALSDQLAAAIPSLLTPTVWAEIEAQYNAPHRFYHAFSHVEEVLTHWCMIDQVGLWAKREETFGALVFHDLFYELSWTPGDSEEISARVARMILSDCGKPLPPDHPAVDVGYDPLDIAYVERLIKLTAKIGRLTPADVTSEEALFLDCDQAILAADEEAYQTHLDDLEQEYVPVKGSSYFKARRLGYIFKMLERPTIFLSDLFRQRFEAQARANLERERLRRDRSVPDRMQLLRDRQAVQDNETDQPSEPEDETLVEELEA